LDDYLESHEGTTCLINWPKALTSFHFGSFYNNDNYVDLPMIASWLQKHKGTLVDLSVGYLASRGRGKLFDLSEFTALESLELSIWQISVGGFRTPRILEFKPEDEILLAPNLKSFKLDFTVYDQHSESWTDLGETEVNWLRSFAEAAVRKNVPFREISICFNPESYGIAKKNGYPWDRMTALQDELRPKGITVSYNEPSLAREEWLCCEDE
jgi:hypothetical protein